MTAQRAAHRGSQHAQQRRNSFQPRVGSSQPRIVHRCSSSSGSGTPAVGSKGVVITGGSKGLGLAMAREFLRQGDRVVLCARDGQRLAAAVAALESSSSSSGGSSSGSSGSSLRDVYGIPCDVSVPEDVSRLGEFAVRTLGCVDIWINNAGQVTRKKMLADVEPGAFLQG